MLGYYHYKATMVKFIDMFRAKDPSMTEDDAKIAALASYMFGSTAADGTIHLLVEKITGADNEAGLEDDLPLVQRPPLQPRRPLRVCAENATLHQAARF